MTTGWEAAPGCTENRDDPIESTGCDDMCIEKA